MLTFPELSGRMLSPEMFDDEDIINKTKEVIAQHPFGKMNPGGGCIYTNWDDSHCIAGEVIVALGGKVPGYDQDGNSDTLNTLIAKFDIEIELTPAAVDMLNRLQQSADSRHPWYYALSEAMKQRI